MRESTVAERDDWKSMKHGNKKKPGLLSALKWVGLWVAIALVFCTAIWFCWGAQPALEFLGGYLIEMSLSMDNLFVFMSIFTAFGVAEHARHRVLHWGILGAVVLRLLFVLLGAALVERFAWVLYGFGVLLLINGVKMLRGEEEQDVRSSPVMRGIRKVLPMTDHFAGDRFFVREKPAGKKRLAWCATPLLGILLLIECSDIIFAIDSVPAVFSISTNTLIVYTSNILAILSLRQLYFVLEYVAGQFQYVRYGVALILLFTGAKMIAVLFGVQTSTGLSIVAIGLILGASIVVSAVCSRKLKRTSWMRQVKK